MRKLLKLGFGMLLTFCAFSQTDSVIFSYQDFIQYVRTYHPITAQANLRVQQAENTTLQNRGQFDPKLYSALDQKDFNGTQYYSVWESGLKVPTWFGADFKLGYAQNSGTYLNPENTVPENGQVALGVSVPLLKNLIYNDRRAAITQAKLMQEASVVELQSIQNDLLYDATKAYWQWVNSYQLYQINKSSIDIAEIRFNAIKESYLLGEKPAVDTLEALIQLQQRQFDTQEAHLGFQNASLVLSNYLWYQNETPLELQPTTVPPPSVHAQLPAISQDSLNQFIARSAPLHPKVNGAQIAINSLDVQRKVNINNLLPELSVDYNLLSGNVDTWENYSNSLAFENYKLGVTFSMPLFLRKERGYLNQVNLKMEETTSKRDYALLQIQNSIKAASNELNTLAQQIVLYQNTYQNYERLYQAELRKFQIGESTLFLVNSREIKALEARIKRAQLLAKYQVTYQKVWYTGGSLK